MSSDHISTILVVIVLPFILITVPLLLLNKAFSGFLNVNPIGKLLRCVIWFLVAGFLIFVSLGMPIILFNKVDQNTASVVTFLIFFVAGVPLIIWIDKNAYVLTDWDYPNIEPAWQNQQYQQQQEQHQPQQHNLDLPRQVVREMPRIVIPEQPEPELNNGGAPIPVNPRVRR